MIEIPDERGRRTSSVGLFLVRVLYEQDGLRVWV